MYLDGNEYHWVTTHDPRRPHRIDPVINLVGTTSNKVRSDMVFFETPNGGAVFSIGFINWIGALGVQGD